MSAYPAELEECVTLREGSEIFLRPLRPEDGPLLQDLLDHMSQEDRRLRFFAPIRRLSGGLLRRLMDVDYRNGIALLAFSQDLRAAPGEGATILGVVRLATERPIPRDRRSRGDSGDKGDRAEFAVALRSDWKGRGLGSLLMQRVLALAPRLGVAEVFGYVLRDNERMLELCREMGFTAAPAPDESDAVLVQRAVAPSS